MTEEKRPFLFELRSGRAAHSSGRLPFGFNSRLLQPPQKRNLSPLATLKIGGGDVTREALPRGRQEQEV